VLQVPTASPGRVRRAFGSNHKANEFVQARALKAVLVRYQFDQPRSCVRVKRRANAGEQLLHQQRQGFAAPLPVPGGIPHFNPSRARPLAESDPQGIAAVPFARFIVLAHEFGVLQIRQLRPQRVDARIVRGRAFVVVCLQAAKYQWHRDHVLQVMVAVRSIGGPVLSMMRNARSWVSMTISDISSIRVPKAGCSAIAASTAVWP